MNRSDLEEILALENVIVVTRHAALVEYLIEEELITEKTKAITHASYDDVKDKIVVGVLPLHMAALAELVVTIPLKMEASDRGLELSIERVREIAQEPQVYKVVLR